MASTKLVNSFSLDYSNGTRGKGRLTFSIYEGSVIQTNAEAIISVDGGGGLSEAIIKAAGNTVCDEIVANKTRKLTENIVTKAGNLQCKYIVHCKCPKWNDYDNGSKKVCLDDLNITVKKALVAACDKGLKSVALPPIGLGNPFGIPKFACSAMYVKAIKEFVEFLPGMKSKLKEIQFFDKSSEMTQLVYNTYQMTNGAGERYLSHESVLMRACKSPASTTQTSHHNGSHSTNTSFIPGQHVQHFQTPYSQAANYQPPPLTYPSSSNSWSQSNIPAAAPPCVPSNWTYIGNVGGADTFNINRIQVLIYTGELPELNNVDILVSTENTRVPGNGEVSDPRHQKEYASALLQGIASFSSASKVKLWAVHIVSLKPETTKLLAEVCRSFCLRPCSQRGQWDNNRVEKMKSPMKKSLEFNPTDYKFIESWTPFNHRKQKADSFLETFPTLSQMTLHEEELTAEEGNLFIINPDSKDAMHSVQDPMIGAQCAVLNSHYICEICMHILSKPVRMKLCKHEFCRECITRFLKQKSACPVCNTVYEERYGDQPLDGIARIYKDDVSLPGYTCGTLIIHYEFPDGRQMEDHPNPGEPYCGISSQCYLPDNKEGRQILHMLRRAFEQRLIFTVGLSQTSGKENVVMRNEIHHKTKRCGGPEQDGYPDPEYLEKVKNGLSANGISDD
uniref:E3 ubiquitin-protein ligase n=1 Tax=Magallana gigas TaxID=29159 RepID=A0A8W8MVM9_MAGGI